MLPIDSATDAASRWLVILRDDRITTAGPGWSGDGVLFSGLTALILKEEVRIAGENDIVVAERDRQWLDEIAQGMGEDLLRFLRARLPYDSDAEDLAQEVYLRLLRVKDRDRIENQRAYILRVAANIANEWRLLARNRLGHSSEALATLIDSADPAREAIVERQMQTLQAALHTLSPKCRAVLLMHRRDRYTYNEIAAEMQISVSMVKKYLVKGLSVCQERLMHETGGKVGQDS